MKDNLLRSLLYAVLFISVYILIQTVMQLVCVWAYSFVNHRPTADVLSEVQLGQNGALLAVSSVFSGLMTIVVFARTRWTPVSNHYLKTKPVGVLLWTILFTIGTILPTEFMFEKIQLTMPDNYEKLFDGVMSTSWGYAALGLLIPVAEEMVFRGAILRKLLEVFSPKWHWVAIVVSALLFGAIHLNVAQGIHAFMVGLALGWVYYRTKSVIPGIALHWVNNTVAYLMFYLMPNMSDGKLIDLFHGDSRLMYGGLFFSMCILIPSIFQLNMRMKSE